jgi:hypothetical protein
MAGEILIPSPGIKSHTALQKAGPNGQTPAVQSVALGGTWAKEGMKVGGFCR